MTVKEVLIIYNDDGDVDHRHGAEKRIDVEDVSKTAEEVDAALRHEGFLTRAVSLSAEKGINEFMREVQKASGGIVFNLCEAAFGASVLEMNVAALLELNDIRFTGSPPLTLGLALDKGLSKDILNSRSVITPAYSVLCETPVRLRAGLDFPVIVKPIREDASVGIDSGAVVKTMREFAKRVDYVIERFRQPAIAEEYIDGREFNVAVIGNGRETRALPPAELQFVDFPQGSPRICSYEAKWDTNSPLYHKTVPMCPADVPDALRDEMADIAVRAYGAMGCRDYARVDMRLGSDGKLRVLEVNPNPDISSNAGLARAARTAGYGYSRFIAEVVSIAAGRYGVSSRRHTPAAGV